MTLHIDTLVAFMPDSTIDNEGKLVPSEALAAGKDAMICLTNYWNSHDIKLLYAAISNACKYAKVDMIDTVLSTLNEENPNLDKPAPPNYFVHHAAIELFSSVKPKNDFNVRLFVAYILAAIHNQFDESIPQ